MQITEIFNAATVTGTAIGYGAGQYLEYNAIKNIRANREALVGTYAYTSSEKLPFLQRAIATVALLGAASGFAYGEIASDSVSFQQQPASVALIVDHTSKTLDGTVNQINTVADNFANKDHNVHTTAVVAHNSTSEIIPINQINNDTPFGQNIFMADAVSRGIEIAASNSSSVNSNAIGSSSEKNAGVIVLTDGNPVGNVLAEDSNHLPVYIYNFDPKSTQIQNYQSITQATGGKYILAQSPKKVDTEINTDVLPHPAPEKSTPDRAPWIFMGVALTAIGLHRAYRRRKETVGETVVS